MAVTPKFAHIVLQTNPLARLRDFYRKPPHKPGAGGCAARGI
jgi:hypothetical protein